jgi:DNA processing protein
VTADLVNWVALNLVLAEDLKSAEKIRRHFHSPTDALLAPRNELVALGISPQKASDLLSKRNVDQAAKDVERCKQKGYTVLTLEDKDYPEYLRETFDPPHVLYCAGDVAALKGPAVSIVGARKPTPYGRAVADKLAGDLAFCGLIVVSGLARGIDSIAHWGAVKEGKTVAVLGSGLDNIYPSDNKKLAARIAAEGAVITEFPLKSKPLGFHFPQRNRIICGLSLATVVIEATIRSGSLITARLALEQNREVMAVPGNITSDRSQGTNWLIKEGAKVVESWEDVVEELPSPIKETLLSRQKKKEPETVELDERGKEIYGHLFPDKAQHIDELLERTGFSVSEALSVLLDLEIKGLIMQLPGKFFQRKL